MLIVKWGRQRKELSYRIEVHPFVTTEESEGLKTKWKSKIKTFYEGEEVSQLFPFKVIFRNTGNQTLEDLPIGLEPSLGAKILELIIEIPKNVEVGNVDCELTDHKRKVQIGFLNEGDEIEAHGIGTSKDVFELTIKVPQPGVKVRNRPEFWTSREALRRALEILARVLLRWA